MFCTLPAFSQAVVDITGATAFREATLLAIKAAYDSTGSAYQYAHDDDAGNSKAATRSIWKGTFPGVAGTTIIRTSFNGSVEGVRAIATVTADPTYYTDIAGNLVTAAAIGGGETFGGGADNTPATPGFLKTAVAAQSEIAFSDVSKDITPYSEIPLLPESPAVGVVVFTMTGNEGTPFTNITDQQFQAILSNGFQPLSLFTGSEADNPTDPAGDGVGANAAYVFATGRNDGSGTRSSYLTETGYGVSTLVNQYIRLATSGDTITAIQRVPAGGVNDSDLVTPGIQPYSGQSATNASTVWGQDVDGNGGYSSGSTLRGDLARTTNSVTVRRANYTVAFSNQKLHLVSWLSLNDARQARDASGGGGLILGYNGVRLTDFAVANSGSSLSVADKAKVTEGAYTAWNYQQMYRRNDLTSGAAVTVYDDLFARIQLPANLGSAGIPIADMHVGRAVDGGIVAP